MNPKQVQAGDQPWKDNPKWLHNEMVKFIRSLDGMPIEDQVTMWSDPEKYVDDLLSVKSPEPEFVPMPGDIVEVSIGEKGWGKAQFIGMDGNLFIVKLNLEYKPYLLIRKMKEPTKKSLQQEVMDVQQQAHRNNITPQEATDHILHLIEKYTPEVTDEEIEEDAAAFVTDKWEREVYVTASKRMRSKMRPESGKEGK